MHGHKITRLNLQVNCKNLMITVVPLIPIKYSFRFWEAFDAWSPRFLLLIGCEEQARPQWATRAGAGRTYGRATLTILCLTLDL